MARRRSPLPDRPMTTQGLAFAMPTWSAADWVVVFQRWSPELLAAVAYPDDQKRARFNVASRMAIAEERWDIVEDLFPHAAPDQRGEPGYRLLAFQPGVTLEQLEKVHPHPQDPLALARAILFRAARHLDGDMVERMIRRGAGWTDQDDTLCTVVGIAARHLSDSDPIQVERAQTLVSRWWAHQPAAARCDHDVRALVSYGESAWVVATLGESWSFSNLCEALRQTAMLGRGDLVSRWLPALVQQAVHEASPPTAPGPAHQALRRILHFAAHGSADPALFGQLWESLRPWCGAGDVELAFEVASTIGEMSRMETLWPHVRPAEVLRMAIDHHARRPTLDWILAQSPKPTRDNYLNDPAHGDSSDLPMALARQRVDRREEAGAAHSPSIVPRRPRPRP